MLIATNSPKGHTRVFIKTNGIWVKVKFTRPCPNILHIKGNIQRYIVLNTQTATFCTDCLDCVSDTRNLSAEFKIELGQIYKGGIVVETNVHLGSSEMFSTNPTGCEVLILEELQHLRYCRQTLHQYFVTKRKETCDKIQAIYQKWQQPKAEVPTQEELDAFVEFGNTLKKLKVKF